MIKWIVIALLAVLLVCAGVYVSNLHDKNQQLKGQYNVANAALESFELSYELERKTRLAVIDTQNTVIEELKHEYTVIDTQLGTVRAELATLVASEPSYPEMETHPLVINLRGQVRALTSENDGIRQLVANLKQQATAGEVKYSEMEGLFGEAETGWEKERTAHDRLKLYTSGIEKELTYHKIKGKITMGATVAVVIVAAYFILGASK